MADKSAFLTAFDEMQKKKGGLNAPAPQGSAVDTVGQAPQVQSPFGQQAGLDAISRDFEVPTYAEGGAAGEQQFDGRRGKAHGSPRLISENISEFISKVPNYEQSLVQPFINEANAQRENDARLRGPNPLAAPIDLAAAPAVQAPQRQAPMLGGFEVKGAGAERFDLGTPEVPETLFSKEYTDPGGNTAAIARIEDERARANAVDPQVSVETPKEFTPTGGAGFLPASSVPVPRDTPDGATFMGDVSTGLGKLSAPFTAHSQAAGGFKPEQPAAASAPFGLADPTSSTATGEDPFSAPIITPTATPAADPDQQIRLADPTSSTVGLNSTQAMLQERFGSPTISGIQSAEEGLGLRTDAQGRMIDPNVDRSSFEQKSADREARQAARPDFGEAVSDRDRRAARGEGISDADRRDIAKAQSPNASASDRARGMKVAEKAGLDWRTGQPLKQDKETGGLTDYQAITAQQRQTEIDLKIADGMEEKEAKREVAYEESRSNVRSTQDSFDKLRPVAEEIALLSGSKLTEGALGWTASKLPFSTDAAQIERLTTEFEGSAFLQGLIDAKAKGATFGALSEREGDRILGQWGKITSPKSTNEQRIRAVNSMLESIQRSSERATSDHKEKFPDRSASSSKAKAQGSPEGKRHAKDQDYAAKVETHFQT